jgi:hypothetical protein
LLDRLFDENMDFTEPVVLDITPQTFLEFPSPAGVRFLVETCK